MITIAKSMVGKPVPIPHGLMIPIAILVSVDDDDDTDFPDVQDTVIKIFISSDTISKSREAVWDSVMNRMSEIRFHYGPKGWMELEENVKNFLTKNDLSSYYGPHIPIPSSKTKH